jgi:hypothetical protein
MGSKIFGHGKRCVTSQTFKLRSGVMLGHMVHERVCGFVDVVVLQAIRLDVSDGHGRLTADPSTFFHARGYMLLRTLDDAWVRILAAWYYQRRLTSGYCVRLTD